MCLKGLQANLQENKMEVSKTSSSTPFILENKTTQCLCDANGEAANMRLGRSAAPLKSAFHLCGDLALPTTKAAGDQRSVSVIIILTF